MAADAWGLSWGGTEGAWGLSWNLGEEPPPPVETPQPAPPVGGHPFLKPLKRPKKLIPVEVSTAIREIAERQVETLELDKQKRFDEFYRELQVREIEWNSRYLTALNSYREHLIHQEIGKLLKQKQKMEEDSLIALLMEML